MPVSSSLEGDSDPSSENPQQSKAARPCDSWSDVAADFVLFVHISRSNWDAAAAFIKRQFRTKLWEKFNFPLHLRRADASPASRLGCRVPPQQPRPCRHKLLGERSAPQLWRPTVCSRGKGGWVLLGKKKKKKKNRVQLICILSKGTTVSSVRAQMALCWGERSG